MAEMVDTGRDGRQKNRKEVQNKVTDYELLSFKFA